MQNVEQEISIENSELISDFDLQEEIKEKFGVLKRKNLQRKQWSRFKKKLLSDCNKRFFERVFCDYLEEKTRFLLSVCWKYLTRKTLLNNNIKKMRLLKKQIEQNKANEIKIESIPKIAPKEYKSVITDFRPGLFLVESPRPNKKVCNKKKSNRSSYTQENDQQKDSFNMKRVHKPSFIKVSLALMMIRKFIRRFLWLNRIGKTSFNINWIPDIEKMVSSSLEHNANVIHKCSLNRSASKSLFFAENFVDCLSFATTTIGLSHLEMKPPMRFKTKTVKGKKLRISKGVAILKTVYERPQLNSELQIHEYFSIEPQLGISMNESIELKPKTAPIIDELFLSSGSESTFQETQITKNEPDFVFSEESIISEIQVEIGEEMPQFFIDSSSSPEEIRSPGSPAKPVDNSQEGSFNFLT